MFNCLWLLTDALDETWKPAVAGFVLHSEDGGRRLIVESDPSRPHDWRREPYQTQLRRWAAAEGQEVLVFSGLRGVRLSVDKGRLVCAAHGASFELERGECVAGPCRGASLTPVRVAVAAA